MSMLVHFYNNVFPHVLVAIVFCFFNFHFVLRLEADVLSVDFNL